MQAKESPEPQFDAKAQSIKTPPANHPVPVAHPKSDKTNDLIIVGFVLAFVVPVIGLVLCIVGLNNAKKKNESGRGLAIAGIIISIINTLIFVIGVGLLLVLATFQGVQQKARDTERTTDIKAISSALEDYYDINQSYPSLQQIDDQNFRSTKLSSLQSDAYKDPSGFDARLATSSGFAVYSYYPTTSTGEPCDNLTKTCEKYTLTAQYELENTKSGSENSIILKSEH